MSSEFSAHCGRDIGFFLISSMYYTDTNVGFATLSSFCCGMRIYIEELIYLPFNARLNSHGGVGFVSCQSPKCLSRAALSASIYSDA
jgi:hypothetical protein